VAQIQIYCSLRRRNSLATTSTRTTRTHGLEYGLRLYCRLPTARLGCPNNSLDSKKGYGEHDSTILWRRSSSCGFGGCNCVFARQQGNQFELDGALAGVARGDRKWGAERTALQPQPDWGS